MSIVEMKNCGALLFFLVFVESTRYRFLAANVGNAGLSCWESKLCDPQVISNIHDYIAAHQPDVIMLSEMYQSSQMYQILPSGYDFMCGASVFPDGSSASPTATGASHEHECVAWNTTSAYSIPNTFKSINGIPDAPCNFDFTAFKIKLKLSNGFEVNPIALHPQSGDGADQDSCRAKEIARYWQILVGRNPGENFIIGGDYNTEDIGPLPSGFFPIIDRTNFWDGNFTVDGYYTADYIVGWFINCAAGNKCYFDHLYSNFGEMSLDYLPWGFAIGGYDIGNGNIHPRMDGGSGCDHRQLLADIEISP